MTKLGENFSHCEADLWIMFYQESFLILSNTSKIQKLDDIVRRKSFSKNSLSGSFMDRVLSFFLRVFKVFPFISLSQIQKLADKVRRKLFSMNSLWGRFMDSVSSYFLRVHESLSIHILLKYKISWHSQKKTVFQ